ncbi:ABC transporter [Acidovorax sp. NO-1]|uniref:ABC transporter ATP-binding protein n=1 Tax=Acidovorax sp. NO-1 TaxID=512030 RepID=UPI00023FD29B|nr:ABC transporter ATP-binding protein [Acidovorax sp. NO-1]EHL22755.1 ABC transporter [Acidovorax sp. NO-1]
MSSEVTIKVENLSKCYQIYQHPHHRLKQFVLPHLQAWFGKPRTMYFKEFWALKNVSFEIKRGETVGIIGRNGSGKSTLLQMICGTLQPTQGSIQTTGRISALLELGSGFNPEFTGRENVYMNGAVLGLTVEEISQRFDDITAFAEIGEFIEQPVKTYSSGMMVRLAFAVAINVAPDILIIDEALSVGDELFQRKCFARIEAIRKSGATILFVSHSGAQIVELCDRAILVDSGENLAIGIPKQIVGIYQKLLYAPTEKQALIREQIRHMTDSQSDQLLKRENQPRNAFSVEPEAQILQENFDPRLTPASLIEYASHGAYIGTPEIFTEDGRRVNNLVRGNIYRYRYLVTFSRFAQNVRFGMLVKTTSGIELGGGTTAQSTCDSLNDIEPDTSYQIDFRFRCSLNPGVYFMNAGVLGDVEGNLMFLHRLVDVAMFRVLSEQNSLATGIVDFECRPNISLISKQTIEE